jgi:hypothetical protein
MKETCPDCGKEYGIGCWPFCNGTGDHGEPRGLQTFIPYIDYHMLDHPVEITSWAQRNRLARENGLIEKDRPSNTHFAERRDRCEWQREVLAREEKCR